MKLCKVKKKIQRMAARHNFNYCFQSSWFCALYWRRIEKYDKQNKINTYECFKIICENQWF